MKLQNVVEQIRPCVVGHCAALLVLCSSSLVIERTEAQTRRTYTYAFHHEIDGDEKAGQGISIFENDFQKIKETVQKRFYDAHFNGVDWAKITDRYHRQLAMVTTRTAFAALINAMLAELHASHTAYVTNDDAEYYMMNSVSAQDIQHNQVSHIGVMGERDGKEYVVHAVMDGGPAEKAGISAGDRLMLADGKPFASAGSFRDKEGTSINVELRRDGDNKTRTVSVVPIKQNILQAYLDATKASARIIEIGSKRIGYVHLWTMAHDAFKETLDNLVQNKLHNTDGLILDLRDGYGGHPFGFVDVFCRPDVAWETQNANGRSITQHTGYAKPIVALINEGTRSAKEFLAYQLKVSHRAKTVGTRTAGAFLGAGFVRIGDGGLLELAELGLKVNGERLEANGVTADVTVPSQFPYTNRDAQRLQAQQILMQMLPEAMPDEKKPGIIHVH